MGYKEIKLLGVDHDWLWNNLESKHFYKEEQSKMVKEGYKEFQNVDLGNLLKSLAVMWGVYKSIKIYSDTKGIEILNLNINSKLDVFEFKKLVNEFH